jgi:hypothetical protein
MDIPTRSRRLTLGRPAGPGTMALTSPWCRRGWILQAYYPERISSVQFRTLDVHPRPFAPRASPGGPSTPTLPADVSRQHRRRLAHEKGATYVSLLDLRCKEAVRETMAGPEMPLQFDDGH